MDLQELGCKVLINSSDIRQGWDLKCPDCFLGLPSLLLIWRKYSFVGSERLGAMKSTIKLPSSVKVKKCDNNCTSFYKPSWCGQRKLYFTVQLRQMEDFVNTVQ